MMNVSTDKERDLKNTIEELESDIEHARIQMIDLLTNTAKNYDIFKSKYWEGQYEMISRVCGILGISVEEQKAYIEEART